MKGYVYLLLAVDQQGNETHKIGISKNHPEIRVKALQTGNASQISVLNLYESVNYKKVERILHARFWKMRTMTQNEWFKLKDEDVFAFLNECQKAEEIVVMLKGNPFYS